MQYFRSGAGCPGPNCPGPNFPKTLQSLRVFFILPALCVKKRGWSRLTAWRTVPAFVFGQFKIQPPNEKIPKSKHNIYIYIKYIDLPQLRGKTCNCRMEMLAPKLSHLVTYVCVCGCSTIDCVLSLSLNFISYCILYSWLYIFNFFVVRTLNMQ